MYKCVWDIKGLKVKKRHITLTLPPNGGLLCGKPPGRNESCRRVLTPDPAGEMLEARTPAPNGSLHQRENQTTPTVKLQEGRSHTLYTCVSVAHAEGIAINNGRSVCMCVCVFVCVCIENVWDSFIIVPNTSSYSANL